MAIATSTLRIVGAGGLTVAMGIVQLRAWADCDVGLNASSRAWQLFLLDGPALFAALVVAVLVPTFVLRGRARLGVTALLAGVVCYAYWIVVVTPAGYPDPICPGNVPPWWPAFLPS